MLTTRQAALGKALCGQSAGPAPTSTGGTGLPTGLPIPTPPLINVPIRLVLQIPVTSDVLIKLELVSAQRFSAKLFATKRLRHPEVLFQFQ